MSFTLKDSQQLQGPNPPIYWYNFNAKHLQEVLIFVESDLILI